ncbi:IS3 family transposase [Bacillus smithii]
MFGQCLHRDFFSYFKTECFLLHSFCKVKEVRDAVHKYIRFYNDQRTKK